MVLLHAGGNIVEFDLAPGEQLGVDTGCIVPMAETVSCDIPLARLSFSVHPSSFRVCHHR